MILGVFRIQWYLSVPVRVKTQAHLKALPSTAQMLKSCEVSHCQSQEIFLSYCEIFLSYCQLKYTALQARLVVKPPRV